MSKRTQRRDQQVSRRKTIPPDWDTAKLEIETRGLMLLIRTQVGVFSWERLDTGTRLLLDAMEVHAGERVLDLGCGYGVLGLVAARLAGPDGHVNLKVLLARR